jgi:hypothetical protein
MADALIIEIKSYMVIWRQLEVREFDGQQIKIRAIVRCTGADPKTPSDAYTMDVMFLAPDSPVPPPTIKLEEKKGYMFMPVSDMLAFVDVLRNEKPIYGHLRGDRPEWTSVTTGQEPVGEGEISE